MADKTHKTFIFQFSWPIWRSSASLMSERSENTYCRNSESPETTQPCEFVYTIRRPNHLLTTALLGPIGPDRTWTTENSPAFHPYRTAPQRAPHTTRASPTCGDQPAKPRQPNHRDQQPEISISRPARYQCSAGKTATALWGKYCNCQSLPPEDVAPVLSMIMVQAASMSCPTAGDVTRPPHNTDAKGHSYSREFKVIRKIDSGPQATTKTPFIMMQKILDEQSEEFRSHNLPRDYSDDDSQAILIVLWAISKQVIITHFRPNVSTDPSPQLLSGIRSEPGTKEPPVTVVPSLHQLVAQVHRMMDMKYVKYDDKQIHENTSATSQLRSVWHFCGYISIFNTDKARRRPIERQSMHISRSDGRNPVTIRPPMTLQLDQRLWNGKTTADQSRHLEYDFPEESAIEALAASHARNQPTSDGGGVSLGTRSRTRNGQAADDGALALWKVFFWGYLFCVSAPRPTTISCIPLMMGSCCPHPPLMVFYLMFIFMFIIIFYFFIVRREKYGEKTIKIRKQYDGYLVQVPTIPRRRPSPTDITNKKRVHHVVFFRCTRGVTWLRAGLYVEGFGCFLQKKKETLPRVFHLAQLSLDQSPAEFAAAKTYRSGMPERGLFRCRFGYSCGCEGGLLLLKVAPLPLCLFTEKGPLFSPLFPFRAVSVDCDFSLDSHSVVKSVRQPIHFLFFSALDQMPSLALVLQFPLRPLPTTLDDSFLYYSLHLPHLLQLPLSGPLQPIILRVFLKAHLKLSLFLKFSPGLLFLRPPLSFPLQATPLAGHHCTVEETQHLFLHSRRKQPLPAFFSSSTRLFTSTLSSSKAISSSRRLLA
ncbi:hypothetical protein VP01_2307g1 [Puccinia sorghi]|uniref:Uncharacterized protein n=1 Tax=Puccinia sorghi TaxID=27349 RepID=A0A0L6V7X5_9BASI|nr:hypothetical protein VP01_2307g1 [Puccinia sorghi]